MEYKFTKDDLIGLTTLKGGRYRVNSINNAYNFCENLAKNHYENFPVGSILIPKELRKHFFAIYAFARIADDIADEIYFESSEFRLNALNEYRNLLENAHISKITNGNPIFIALNKTIREIDIPLDPLLRLIKAFEIDSCFIQPKTFQDLIEYCKFSANPIGELILRIFNEASPDKIILSDRICTALQLTNFWQDLSRDIEIGRNYIPIEFEEKFELRKEYLHENEKSVNLIRCMDELFLRTELLFNKGSNLIELINNNRLKLELKATLLGGRLILNKCRYMGVNLTKLRPKLTKLDYLKLVSRVLF